MQAYFNSKLGHASKVFLEEEKRNDLKFGIFMYIY